MQEILVVIARGQQFSGYGNYQWPYHPFNLLIFGIISNKKNTFCSEYSYLG